MLLAMGGVAVVDALEAVVLLKRHYRAPWAVDAGTPPEAGELPARRSAYLTAIGLRLFVGAVLGGALSGGIGSPVVALAVGAGAPEVAKRLLGHIPLAAPAPVPETVTTPEKTVLVEADPPTVVEQPNRGHRDELSESEGRP
ncbi:hypothetical protein GCM10010428_81100 [Actinosynnema pretiosum subsp. pretiosum]